MHITAIRPWIIQVPWSRVPGEEPSEGNKRELLFCQVDTDEGITGWGEVTTYPGAAGNRSVAHMIREVGSHRQLIACEGWYANACRKQQGIVITEAENTELYPGGARGGIA